MEWYSYQKKRYEMGKAPGFVDTELKLFGYVPSPNLQPNWSYVERDPNYIVFDNIPELSEHTVNTERIRTLESAMSHREGGWPATIDPTEAYDVTRLKKKMEKESRLSIAVPYLTGMVKDCIRQNNQIDLFEEYFVNEPVEHYVEQLSLKTLMLFKDQSELIKRSIADISWHPEGSTKLAAAYSILRFQQMPAKTPLHSYVWDLTNPNKPDLELHTQSPLTCISFNPKLTDQIGAGCYNGLVCIWDVKKGSAPVLTSPVEGSHHDPVTALHWLGSKTGNELLTTSTDGKVYWWDTRKLSEGPVDSLLLSDTIINADSKEERTVGGTSIEYNTDAGVKFSFIQPNKFLIGNEQGYTYMANKKPKKSVELTQRYGVDSGKHLGPVYNIHRNPMNPRYFLTVGDWSAKVWFEELKAPIIKTRYHTNYLSSGCWSPSRMGVFFLTRRDGWLDVWDFYYRQNELALSYRVSDTALTSIKICGGSGHHGQPGKHVAVGDQNGTVTLIELCESLYTYQPKEKEIINEMFDRETRKEKHLELIKKQSELKKTQQRESAIQKKWEAKKNELAQLAEEEFMREAKLDELDYEDSVGEYGLPKREMNGHASKEHQENDEENEEEEEKKEIQEGNEEEEKNESKEKLANIEIKVPTKERIETQEEKKEEKPEIKVEEKPEQKTEEKPEEKKEEQGELKLGTEEKQEEKPKEEQKKPEEEKEQEKADEKKESNQNQP